MFDGGLVSEALVYPRGEGRLAVRAVWTGIDISASPRKSAILHQIKNDIFVGTWRIVGIDSHCKTPREIIVIVERDEISQTIDPGDILILGRGAVSKYATNEIEPRPDATQAVEVGTDRLRGILSRDRVLGTVLLVLHNPADDVTARDLGVISTPMKRFTGDFAYIGTTIARYTLEFKLSGKAVAARSIINLLTPTRSFVLDASEEICLGVSRKRGRRTEEESELFDPVITAKAASVRFRLHPSSSPRTRDLETSRPLKLLSEVLQKANSGDKSGVLKALQANLKSVDESLKQIEAIVKTAQKQRLEFSSTDAPTPIALGNRALSTIRSVDTSEWRTRTVQGDIYAVDLRRRWCRVSTSDTDLQEDWKLEFSDDLSESVRGEYPRRVQVQFETESRPGITSGKGLLLNIEDLS